MNEPDFDTDDHRASKRLTTFAADHVPTLSLPERSTREGDEGSETLTARVELDRGSGMTVEGRLRSVGGTATPEQDYEAVDVPVTISPFTQLDHRPDQGPLGRARRGGRDDRARAVRHRRRAARDGTRHGHDRRRRRSAPAGPARLPGLSLARLRRGPLVRPARAQAGRAVGPEGAHGRRPVPVGGRRRLDRAVHARSGDGRPG